MEALILSLHPKDHLDFRWKIMIKLRFLIENLHYPTNSKSLFTNIHSIHILFNKYSVPRVHQILGWVDGTIMKEPDTLLRPLRTSWEWGVSGTGQYREQLNKKWQYIMNYNDVLPVREAQMRGPQTHTWGNKVTENVSQNKRCLSCGLNVKFTFSHWPQNKKAEEKEECSRQSR